MIKVTIQPGKSPSTETVVFNFPQAMLKFPSHLEARKWQFHRLFGDNPDFSSLADFERTYISTIFDLENDISPKLVLAYPCSISHLQRLVNALGRKVVVENFLVSPAE